MRPGQEPGREAGQDHLQREHDPPAPFLGPYAEEQPGQRSGQDRGGDEKPELKLVQAKLRLDRDADDGEDRPDCEADRECQGAQAQRPALIRP